MKSAGLAGRLGRATAGLLAVAFIAMLVYGLIAQAPDTRIDERLARAQAAPAPGFTLPVLLRGELGRALGARMRGPLADGQVDLRELRGTPIVLNFWASWCIPCAEEAPRLERAWRSSRRRGVLFVGLNMQDASADARTFMTRFGVSYLNIKDQDNDVARDYGATGLPETFFITARGQIVGHVIGVVSSEQLEAGIAAARSGRTSGSDSGGDRRPVR